jgi:hypothetical protein
MEIFISGFLPHPIELLLATCGCLKCKLINVLNKTEK